MLYVRNLAQKVLWESEIRGQLSDGYWENARPSGHWIPWCETKVEINPVNVGRDFYVSSVRYNLVAKELIDAVGLRMMQAVRLAKVYGDDCYKAIADAFDENGELEKYEGEFFDKRRAAVAGYDHKAIQVVMLDRIIYGRGDLIADLKDLKQIMLIKIQPSVATAISA